MKKVQNVYDVMNDFAPFAACAPWDNVGLLVGEAEADVKKTLVVLDADLLAVQSAIKNNCELIVTHHPIIYSAMKSITDDTSCGKLLLELIRNNIAVISAHTNLDAAKQGINDRLAEIIGMKDVVPFFEDGVHLARYGEIGPVEPQPFIETLKNKLGTPYARCLLIGGKLNKVASLCGGSNLEAMQEAARLGCDTFITGEVKYSAFVSARLLGLNIIELGHFETENIIIPPLRDMLASELNGIEFITVPNKDSIRFI